MNSARHTSAHAHRRNKGEQSTEMLYSYLSHLRPFLTQDDVDEVCINRPGEVWTEGAKGWIRYEVPELTYEVCYQLGKLVASFNKKAISEDKPVLSAQMLYGERAQVIMPPACEPGTISITIRKPSVIQRSLDDLDREGAFNEYQEVDTGIQPFELELMQLRKDRKIRDFLDLAVKKRRTILIVGKTGSGKTTVMRSLVGSIPFEERLITLEDVHEVFLDHPNRVHLFYAREDEGGSKVSPKQALASCLRMKPDRILLAELRGDEAWEFVKSCSTGHPGSISTMHANGALECFEQLTALIKDSRTGQHLDADYIKRRLFTTIDVVLFYHHRRLREIYYDPEHKRKYLG